MMINYSSFMDGLAKDVSRSSGCDALLGSIHRTRGTGGRSYDPGRGGRARWVWGSLSGDMTGSLGQTQKTKQGTYRNMDVSHGRVGNDQISRGG